MKKVININFQGQIIPIEETAYEMLQLYVASLRTYFFNEEGRDEIINDIESRIAELFGETLKKGAACITDEEVARIMNSMGRPEDFDTEGEGTSTSNSHQEKSQSSGLNLGDEPFSTNQKKRLYRDEEDKMIGGVASGLANYLNVDPAIIRVIFALLAIFGGSGILVYIVLWIVLPSRSLVTNIRKRLFRDPDDRVISGVAGGLAKYFDINPAIPRIIFAAPFILGLITSITSTIFYSFPAMIGSFGGGTFILAYIILWIVLPEAKTAAEKLEMRGEKVDLNSIRNTIVSDLEGVKSRAMKAGGELQESARKFGSSFQDTAGEKSAQFSKEVAFASRRTGTGIGRVFGILIKAFVYFIVGTIAFALFIAAIALMVGGVGILPLHNFLLFGTTQHMAAWGTLILFLGVPVLALLVWIIRKLMGAKTKQPFLGYTFAGLWIIGIVCVLTLIGSLNRSFSNQAGVREEVNLTQPTSNYLNVSVEDNSTVFYDSWMDFDGLLNINGDTLILNTVKVNVIRSKDSSYHAYMMKISKGSDPTQAEALAKKIEFNLVQNDSMLYLPASFKVSRDETWRNQKIVLVIEVPEGKYIELDESIGDYDYFNVQFNRRNRNNNWNFEWDDNGRYYQKGIKLEMTNDGLKSNSELRNGSDEYRFDEDSQPVENSNADQPDSTTTVIEEVKKPKEDYRYSQNIQKYIPAPEEVLPKTIMINTNPLTAMMKF